MPKISTYPVVPLEPGDYILISDASDSNATKNVLASSVTGVSVSYTEMSSTAGNQAVTQSVWIKMTMTTAVGLTNDPSLVVAATNRITNIGQLRRYWVTYSLTASAASNNNIMFRIALDGNINSIVKSEIDIICGGGGAKGGSGSGSFIVDIAQNSYIELWTQNLSSGTTVTLEHFNLVMRQI